MRLKDILKPEHVVSGLESSSRDQVIRELVSLIASEVPMPEGKLVEILIEREEQSPTAMSGQVAVPHARIKQLSRFIMAVGRSGKGVDFGAKEGPTRIFFLLIAPTDDTANHLKILARIARMCRNADFRKDIIDAKDSRGLYQRIMKEDEVI